MTVTRNDILSAIDQLGLSGKTLCVHSSLKSFGSVEGGISTLIEPFLEKQCTLLVPTFTYMYGLPSSYGRVIKQNGCDYDESEIVAEDGVFDPESNVISKEMGAIPAHILRIGGRRRGIHPLNSFGSVGPKAGQLIETQGDLDVYGPYQKVYRDNDGFLVLMGVGLTRATPIHFAEQMAGRNLFRRWAKGPDGKTREIAVGSCSEGFDKLDEFVKSIEKRLIIGESVWRVYSFREFIDTLTAAIIRDNSVTHCDDLNCIRCNDAVNGGSVL